MPFDVLATPELCRALAAVSHTTGRQVGALVHRSGHVEYVVVGDSTKLMLPDIGRLRGGSGRFRGLRLLHTHVRSEPLSRDDLVDLTRLRLDLVAALCLNAEGHPQTFHYAHCIPLDQKAGLDDAAVAEPFRVYGPIPYGQLRCNPRQLLAGLEEEFARASRLRPARAKDGRAILVHLSSRHSTGSPSDSLRELADLARTAGLEVADSVVQTRDRIDSKYVLGRGKLEQVVLRAMQLDVEVLLFDGQLSPAQCSAIGRLTDLKIIDRTQLILDIFAQHAQSRDGKLQVELAQMRYLLPRLGSRDDSLSRLTGGIGGRGPGETKLEIGRRRARERIARLEARLAQLGRQRRQRRRRRTRAGVPVVAVIGYTNAGKSTLVNALARSDLLTADKLFATLDPRSRRVHFSQDRYAIVSDTVGFIRDLPSDLVTAFRATFEELVDADLLLHVLDVSDPGLQQHLATTDALLRRLELDQIPRMLVLNKSDKLGTADAPMVGRGAGALAVSAHEPDSLGPLRSELERRLFAGGPPPLQAKKATPAVAQASAPRA
ncbi:MAG: GTPase HflX [Proteobacteria bacterium]|nr:GTPase HflX [Pseudomonadota bacterium]